VSAPVPRLLRLGDGTTRAAGLARRNDHGWLNEPARLVGDKAARLAGAAAAGLAVLPGWVVPVAEGRPALSAGAAAVRQGRPSAARRAVLGYKLDDALAAELRDAAAGLGGRVIVRSSSPLEADPRWSGAFSTVAEVGPDDVVAAVRSCWASAFAVDPLARLAACCLPPEALELGVLLQPEIRPVAGGVARVTPAAGVACAEVMIEGVLGHPGVMLAGWADGVSGPELAALIGTTTVAAVADLAGRVWRRLGDDVIEWAAVAGGEVWLLQSQRSGAVAHEAAAAERLAAGPEAAAPAGVVRPQAAAPAGEVGPGAATPMGRARPGAATPMGRARPGAAAPVGGADRGATVAPGPGSWAGALPSGRASMPLLAATVLRRGEHVPGRAGAPGTAAGLLLACRPHERPAGDCQDAILLVDRPVPALAPLLFAARGVIARTGAAGSHLAEVARSLGVPMVLGCHPERVTGPPAVPDGAFLAAIDGSSGDVALLPATEGWPVGGAESGLSALSGLHHPASARPARD
jgi:phosphohistidine swiveling domain-containing protein